MKNQTQLIAWRSLENADVVNAGSVRFQKGPTGHGSYVRVTMNYNPLEDVHMTKPEISGIAPFFIVKNVPAALSFYRDRLQVRNHVSRARP